MCKKATSVVVISMILLLALNACKRGCTDSNALNPTAGAKEDDGTCMYCDSQQVKKFFNFTSIWDGQPGSPYFQSTVLQVTVNLIQPEYNGNGCAAYGLVDNNATCIDTRNSLTLFNLTPSTMIFSGTVRISYSSFPLSFIDYPLNSAVIPPNDSLVVQNAGTACVPKQNFFGPGIDVLSPTMQYQ